MIAAYAADQLAADQLVAAMEREALPACVEHGAHLAIGPAREHEAKFLPCVVGVAVKLRGTGAHREDIHAHFVLPGNGSSVRGRSEDQKSHSHRERRAAQYFKSAETHMSSSQAEAYPKRVYRIRLNSSPLI